MAKTYRFTRDELRAYALGGGVREHVRKLEQDIARLQREFPDVMIDTPIVLLKAEARTDGQAWPALSSPQKHQASWTPERRAKQAAAMRKRQGTMQRAKQAKQKAAAVTPPAADKAQPHQPPTWERMRQMLLTAPDQQATSKAIQAAAGMTAVNVALALTEHPKLFKRIKPGVYALRPAGVNGNGAHA